MLGLALILASLLGASSVEKARGLSCNPLPGIDRVLTRSELKYVLFGEYHGTVEMPELAGDAVCAAAQAGRPVVVGIELSPVDQQAIDRFMASDGDAEARAALLSSTGWQEEGGRTTAAIADLLEAVRKIGKNSPLTVIAFDTAPEPGTSPKREAAMAEALTSAASEIPGSLVVALTGLGHADKEGFISRTPPFLAAAGRLPAGQTVSLAFARPGGQYWGCHSPAGDTSLGCTVYDMPVREPVAPRGIVLDANLRSGFDGVYHPGKAYSASRPARGVPPAATSAASPAGR